jgi:glutamine---fructose-6-phosphate transaminase (isomerizing)
MLQEAQEIPALVASQLRVNSPLLAHVADQLRRRNPRLVITCARGSSSNAATYAKYLIETQLGIPVLASAPSVGALYRARVDLTGSIMLCISQSGSSFDLVENAKWGKARGAWVISLLNEGDSPLARESDVVVALRAGVERSVAATKSYAASLSAVLQLIASWKADGALDAVLDALPRQLELAATLDWSAAVGILSQSDHLLVVGRGLGLCTALEVALKFKEACGIHAEAFSGADLLHGPLTLLRHQYPVLVFGQDDETAATTQSLLTNLLAKGTQVISVGASIERNQRAGEIVLPVVPGVDPIAASITALPSFYGLLSHVAVNKGTDPDNPAYLVKATQTL